MTDRLSALERHWQKPWLYFLLLTALAAATPLAFAPYYHFWLMPLLLAALFRLTELKPQRRVSSGYWFGLVAYGSQFWWIHTSMHDIGGMPEIYAVPLTLLLPAFLALYPAAVFWLLEKYRLPRWAQTGVVLPLLWTLAEFARERVLTGFGWGAVGYSQIADASPLAGFAPVGGIHLVTLVTVLLAGWLVLAVGNRILRQRLLFAAAALALLAGGHVLRGIGFTRGEGQPVSVGLVQGNIEQQFKFDPDRLAETYRRYYELVSSSHAQIVVLPETAFPQFLSQLEPGLIEVFAEAAKRNGSALALGVPVLTDDGRNYLNAAINLQDYDSEYPDRFQLYAKNHLVPFGEYKPLPAISEPVYRFIDMPLGDFQRGGAAQKPFDMAGQKVAFNICYEDGFGDELIESARHSTLLANISNLAWFGGSNAMWQQLQQSQARALELGRYMIRATNTGATAIVSPQGQVIKLSRPQTATVLEGYVRGMHGETPYMKLGGSLPLIGSAALLALALLFVRPKAQPSGSPDKADADKPAADGTGEKEAESEKPEPEKPEPEKPEPEKPEPEKPEPEKPEPEKPESEKPESEKPESEKPESEKPH